MTNEKDSDSPITDANAQSPPQPPMAPPVPLQGALANDGKGQPDNNENQTNELAREFRIAEKWVIGTNIVLAIIGIFALCIYHGQLEVMRGQLAEIIKQFPEIQKSANAAKSAADTANATLKASQQQFRLEQRPYIWAIPEQGATDKQTQQKMFLVPLSGDRYQISWIVKIKTGGRSPAKDEISTDSETHFVEKTKFTKEVRDYVPHYAKTPGDTMPPDVTATVRTGQWLTFSKEQYANIVNATWVVYIIGAVRYRDIFEPSVAPYETRYCFVYLPVGLPIGTCSEGNTMK
jgi:hypothetical protein